MESFFSKHKNLYTNRVTMYSKLVPFIKVVFVVVLLSVPLPTLAQRAASSAIGDAILELPRQFMTTAVECGNPTVGDEAAQCVTLLYSEITATRSYQLGSEGEDPFGRFLAGLNRTVNCLRPYEALMVECGKDNDVTFIESARWLAYEGKRFKEEMDSLHKSIRANPCDSAEESRVDAEMKSCLPDVKEMDANQIHDEFCGIVSGFRKCLHQVFLDVPNACERDKAFARFFDQAYEDIERNSEYEVSVKRCFSFEKV